MKLVHLFLLCVVLSAAVAAQTPLPQPERVQPKPADFAMQLPLHVSGSNGVVQLRLPLVFARTDSNAPSCAARTSSSIGAGCSSFGSLNNGNSLASLSRQLIVVFRLG